MVFGRAERQVARIRRVTDDYRSHDHEGAADHVPVGVHARARGEPVGGARRRVDRAAPGRGRHDARAGLFVLVLAPEVFLPLRNVGAAFHASAAGLTASRDAFDLLGRARAARVPAGGAEPRRAAPPAAGVDERAWSSGTLRVRRGDRVVLDGFDLDAAPGEVVAVTGASGSGQVEPDRRAARLRRRRRASVISTGRRLSPATGPRSHGPAGAARSSRARSPRTCASATTTRTRPRSRASTSPASSSTPNGGSGPAAAASGRAGAARRHGARDPPAARAGRPTAAPRRAGSRRQDADREAALGERLRELAATGASCS